MQKMNEDNNGLKPNVFFSLPGSKEWKPLGTAIETPHFPEEKLPHEPMNDFNKQFSCSAEVVVKSKKQQRELRKLFYGKKQRLPRKMKKAMKKMCHAFNEYTRVVVVWIDGDKPFRSKWDRKAARNIYKMYCVMCHNKNL